jgi:hypothetical protein
LTVKQEYIDRWLRELAIAGEGLKRPQDLVSRGVSSADFLDCAVIGGFELKEIIAGHVAESQIPQDVINAFHEQYPNVHEGFVEVVSRLGKDPDVLGGLINGVKGKLFEVNYVEWLNQHLPAGFHAALAENANNPAWDIAVTDSHGDISEFLQLKATDSLAYIRQALEAHPNIDVVSTAEVFNRIADHPELAAHVVDSGQNLTSLTNHVGDAVEHAEAADIAFHIPLFAIAFAVSHSYWLYRTGKESVESAIRKATERSALAVIASGMGWATAAAAHEPIAGLPVAVITRYYGGRAIKNYGSRRALDASLSNVDDSISKLRLQLDRPVLDGLLPSDRALGD